MAVTGLHRRWLTALAAGALVATACALPRAAGGQGWENLGPRERYEALHNYWRHKRLPKERRRDVEESYERWQQMSPEDRDRVRQRYERFRQLPPTERQRMEREHRRRKRESPSDD